MDKKISELLKDYFKNNIFELPQIEEIKLEVIEDIDKGNFIPKEYLLIYFLYKDDNLNNDPVIQNYINKLEQKLFYMKEDNFFKLNLINTIFLLEILNNNFENGLIDYCKRLFIFTNIYLLVNEDYFNFLREFISELNDNSITIEIFKNTLDVNFINKLNFKNRVMIFTWIDVIFGCMNLSQKERINVLYDLFKKLLYWLIGIKAIREVMVLETLIYSRFSTAVENLVYDFKKLEDEICKPCRELYKEWIKNHKELFIPAKKEVNKEGKIKLAFVRPIVTFWSPFKLEYSLIKALLNDEKFIEKYELYFYLMTIPDFLVKKEEDECVKMLEDLGIKVIRPTLDFYYEGPFADRCELVIKFREKLIKDEIDIVIYSDHFYSVGEFLFLSRCAPKQIYWVHMNHEVDFEGIDKRIIHYPPPPNSRCKDKFEVFKISQDEIFLRGNEEKYKEKAKEIRKKFPPDAIILGSIGRLIKVDNYDYLSAVAEILKQNPETIYLACGEGYSDSIKEKLKKLNIDENRFFLEGWVEPKVYRYVIDIYLNTFPFSSGEALSEFCAKDGEKYVVSLENQYNFTKDDISNYVNKSKEFIKQIKFHRKYKKVYFTKEDFWNFSLLKDHTELFLSYDKIVEEKNVDLLKEILIRFDNIKILIDENDYDKLTTEQKYKPRIIIENDIYERAYKSDFFMLFENKQDIFEFVRDYTTARIFNVEFIINKSLWKNSEERFKKHKNNIIKAFKKFLINIPENSIEFWWILLRDCFNNYNEYEKFIYLNTLGNQLVIDRLLYETQNMKLLARLKVTQRINRIEPEEKVNQPPNSHISKSIKKRILEAISA